MSGMDTYSNPFFNVPPKPTDPNRRMSNVITEGLSDAMSGKFNHAVAAGLAQIELPKAPQLLHDLLKACFPHGEQGLKYLEYRKVDPLEAARVLHSKRSSNTYDISKSTVVMYAYKFEIGLGNDKEEYEQFIFLPYSERGGVLILGGAQYVARPVPSDKVLSPGEQDMFMRLMRDKLSVTSTYYSCICEGKSINNDVIPVLSIFKSKTRTTTKPRICSTVMLYLMGKYPIYEVLALLGGKGMEIVDLNTYLPIKGRSLYQSRGVDSKTVNNVPYRKPTIGITVDTKKRDGISDMIAANLFFILDMFPDTEMDGMMSVPGWRMKLGRVISPGKKDTWLQSSMDNHYTSLERQYFNSIMEKIVHQDFDDLLEMDFSTDGFYKLLIVVYRNYTLWMRTASAISGSLYDKRLSINYYILYRHICKINEIFWGLVDDKNNGRTTKKSVLEKVRLNFTIRSIHTMPKEGSHDGTNISCKSIIDHSPQSVYRLASLAELQLNSGGSSGANHDKSKQVKDPSTLLHETQIPTGSYTGMGAKRLAPALTLNIFIPLDDKTMTVIPPDLTLLHLEPLREVLGRMTRNNATLKVPKEFNRFVKSPKKRKDW